MMRWSALLLGLVVVAGAADARADGPVAPPFGGDVTDDAKPRSLVPLAVDVEGPVRVVTGSRTLRCAGPCSVEVEPGSVGADVRPRPVP